MLTYVYNNPRVPKDGSVTLTSVKEAGLKQPESTEEWCAEATLFYDEFCSRLSRLCAHWTSVGFVHGVLNTDNIALSGDGIDYGPACFIDILEASCLPSVPD